MSKSPKPRLDRIIVAVDFSEPSVLAARWAADHFAPEAEVVLVHIIEPPPATRSNVMRYPSMETIVNKAHLDVETRLNELRDSIAPSRSRAEIRVGSPHDELVQLAVAIGADVIVAGRQDLSSSGWARVGTTAQRVVRKTSLPVLLVAGVQPHSPDQILIAVDDSDMTDDVLGWGMFLAERFAAKATVVHAAGDEGPDDDDSWITEQIGAAGGGGSIEQRVTRAPVRPAEAIIAETRDLKSELVVIGSRGAGAAHQMLFGSVAESVLLSSPCPVFVVVPA